jgi:intracellular multiplication protein IcmK
MVQKFVHFHIFFDILGMTVLLTEYILYAEKIIITNLVGFPVVLNIRKLRPLVFFCLLIVFLLCLGTGKGIAQDDVQSLLPSDLGGGQERPQTVIPEGPPAPGDDLSAGLGLPAEEGMGGGQGTLEYKTPAELEAEIRRESFDAALQNLLPLNAKELRELLEYYDHTQEAVQVPVYPYPRPEVSVLNISLDPGITPPVIAVATGHVSTLTMLDVTGAPWPIQDVSWAGNFEVLEPEEGGHVVRITPMAEFAYGNISIRLLTLKTPITFTLRTQRDIVHYRVDARIPEYGPFANAPLLDGGKSMMAGDPDITSILDGAPPAGAGKLLVSGVD